MANPTGDSQARLSDELLAAGLTFFDINTSLQVVPSHSRAGLGMSAVFTAAEQAIIAAATAAHGPAVTAEDKVKQLVHHRDVHRGLVALVTKASAAWNTTTAQEKNKANEWIDAAGQKILDTMRS